MKDFGLFLRIVRAKIDLMKRRMIMLKRFGKHANSSLKAAIALKACTLIDRPYIPERIKPALWIPQYSLHYE